MPNTERISKNEQFSLSSGELTIKSIPGDAHLTTSRIYLNGNLIKNGTGLVEALNRAKSGDQIFIIATINLPDGGSDFASLSIQMNDTQNSDHWDYTSKAQAYDEVIYEVTINLN